jgi:hypothetical protein
MDTPKNGGQNTDGTTTNAPVISWQARRIMKFSSAVAAGLFLLHPLAASAAEGSVYGGPIGGSDMRSAYLPSQPGVYLGITNYPGIGSQLVGNNGQKSVAHFNVLFDMLAGGALVVYPVKLDGGTLATYAQAGAGFASAQANSLTENTTGALDIYSDLLKWSKYYGVAAPAPSSRGAQPRLLPYGLTLDLAYSMIFPTGRYNTHDLFTQGHNDYFIIPNFAVTYLTGPELSLGGDGTEFSGRLYYDHALENPATDYVSGDVVDADFAVTERYGHWQMGLAGAAADQLFNDTKNGLTVQPDGKRLKLVKLGPVLAYDVPGTSITLKAKYLTSVYVRNTTDISGLIMSISFKLL